MTEDEAKRFGAGALRKLVSIMDSGVPYMLVNRTAEDAEMRERFLEAARTLRAEPPMPAPVTLSARALNLDGD